MTCLSFGTFTSYRSGKCLSKLMLSRSVSESKPPMQKQTYSKPEIISSTAVKRRASEFLRQGHLTSFECFWVLTFPNVCGHTHNTCVSQTCHGHIQDLDANLSPAAERQSFKCSGARLCAQMTKAIKCRAWRRDYWIVPLDRLAQAKQGQRRIDHVVEENMMSLVRTFSTSLSCPH